MRPQPVAAQSGAITIPDIVDPCLLVTAEEVGKLFGAPATTKRTTPQPRTQNDCFYSGAGGLSFTVTSFNGKGLDPAGYIQRREREGGVPLAAIGDRAVQTYRAATGLVSVDFVIGAASVSLLVAGVEPNRAQPAMIELARQAADRLTSMAAYDMGGVERFVGAWRVVTHAKDSRSRSRRRRLRPARSSSSATRGGSKSPTSRGCRTAPIGCAVTSSRSRARSST
jgi:hypothetical protein